MIRKVMDAIYQSVGGLDVHQGTVVACRRRLIENGQAGLEIRTFQTTSAELRELVKWVAHWAITHMAMESTGIYWVPVWNVLEENFKQVLVNAQHLKKVPGRKDDQLDAEWIVQCMQCGLLRRSFVPALEVRQWRHLTRQRVKLTELKKKSYLAALYHRLAPRRGRKRAIIAVARTILQSAWHILKEDVDYKELGGDYFDHLNEEKTASWLVKRLKKLGYDVELKSKKARA